MKHVNIRLRPGKLSLNFVLIAFADSEVPGIRSRSGRVIKRSAKMRDFAYPEKIKTVTVKKKILTLKKPKMVRKKPAEARLKLN